MTGVPPPHEVACADVGRFLDGDCGASTQLNWPTTDAPKVEISGTGAVAASGQQSVQPTQTTDHKLTATGPGGTVSNDTSVNVNASIQSTLSAEPSQVRYYKVGGKVRRGRQRHARLERAWVSQHFAGSVWVGIAEWQSHHPTFAHQYWSGSGGGNHHLDTAQFQCLRGIRHENRQRTPRRFYRGRSRRSKRSHSGGRLLTQFGWKTRGALNCSTALRDL